MTGPILVAGLAVGMHPVVSHVHHIMVSGSVMARFGALHSGWPDVTSRLYPEIRVCTRATRAAGGKATGRANSG